MIPLYELLKLKFPDADLLTQIQLGDHGEGEGAEIVIWNLEGVPVPSTEELNNWQIDYDLVYRQRCVMNTRKSLYPSWERQLQMQYSDLLNDTTTWKDTLAAIKAANPIPME